MEVGYRESLVRNFSEAGVRRVIWECDNSKSPGPNGVKFGFIKEFWASLKDIS